MDERADEVRVRRHSHDRGDPEEIEEIRDDIEVTRGEMSETVDAIQERLNPQRMMDQARGTVREATVGRAERAVNNAGDTARETGSNLMETIRENPIPAAMAAIGIGWLFMSTRGGPSRHRLQETQGRMGESVHRGQEMVGQRTHQAREQAEHVGRQARHQAQRGVEQVEHMGEQARQQARRGAEQVEHMGEQAQHRAEQTRHQFQEMMEENPFAVGAAAIGLGAALGFALPETRTESEISSETWSGVMQRAKTKMQETRHKVERVADEAQKAARQESERQNLA